MEIVLPDLSLDHLLDHPLIAGLLDAVSDGVLVIGLPDRQILAMNQAARDALGYKTKEVVGCQCKKMMNSPACSNACPLTAALEGRTDRTRLNLYYRGREDKRLLHARTRMLLVKSSAGEPLAGIEIFRDLRQERALRAALQERTRLSGIIGGTPAMTALYELVEQVAPFEIPVLIVGESGVGKERFADALHAHSKRAEKPLLKINCAALSESLVESSLFGHRRGAFTGADRDRKGFFEEANGATLFLDEVGELPIKTQAKLLRVLQQGEVQRLGEDRIRHVDVRILAATNQPLADLIKQGAFRQDLYYRLAGVEMKVPPLRERLADLPALVDHFLPLIQKRLGHSKATKPALSQEAMAALTARTWPGNVRELENCLQLACIRAGQAETLEASHLGESQGLNRQDTSTQPSIEHLNLADLEQQAIATAMARAEGHLPRAAELLGINRSTLWRKLKKTDAL